MVGVGSESGSLTYDDAPRPSVRLHALGVHPFAVRRLSYHLIGSLVALHAGLVQSRRAASAPRTLKFLVVLRLSEGIPQNTLSSLLCHVTLVISAHISRGSLGNAAATMEMVSCDFLTRRYSEEEEEEDEEERISSDLAVQRGVLSVVNLLRRVHCPDLRTAEDTQRDTETTLRPTGRKLQHVFTSLWFLFTSMACSTSGSVAMLYLNSTSLCSSMAALATFISSVCGSTEYREEPMSFFPPSLYFTWRGNSVVRDGGFDVLLGPCECYHTWLCSSEASLACSVSRVSGSVWYRALPASFLLASLYLACRKHPLFTPPLITSCPESAAASTLTLPGSGSLTGVWPDASLRSQGGGGKERRTRPSCVPLYISPASQRDKIHLACGRFRLHTGRVSDRRSKCFHLTLQLRLLFGQLRLHSVREGGEQTARLPHLLSVLHLHQTHTLYSFCHHRVQRAASILTPRLLILRSLWYRDEDVCFFPASLYLAWKNKDESYSGLYHIVLHLRKSKTEKGQTMSRNSEMIFILRVVLVLTDTERTSLCMSVCSLACCVSMVSGSREYRLMFISFFPSSLYFTLI
ncbi:hypothetical protein F7725_028948 [Dissostichus mawsoni]|uniref:Uncharacterized protein n=1 Tax=Dissostichus mawsoni TaxID=36200 RepID=A0A7J5XHE7_DISMA|nr:hypothetical protein F7725_028948 [Dissostichus mawsoni]